MLFVEILGGLPTQPFPRWELVNSIFQLPGRTGRCLGTYSACGTSSGSWIPCTVPASRLPGTLPSTDEGRRAEGFSFPLGAGWLGEPKRELCAGCHGWVTCVFQPKPHCYTHQRIKYQRVFTLWTLNVPKKPMENQFLLPGLTLCSQNMWFHPTCVCVAHSIPGLMGT